MICKRKIKMNEDLMKQISQTVEGMHTKVEKVNKMKGGAKKIFDWLSIVTVLIWVFSFTGTSWKLNSVMMFLTILFMWTSSFLS